MKNSLKHFLTLTLVFLLMLSCFVAIPSINTEVSATYENTHINTGNQAYDIVAVAQTQIGYQEGSSNSNKYSAAFGSYNVAWCAYFVSWCAKEAGISDSVIHRQGIASPFSGYFNVPNTHGSSDYFPKPGDLVFYGPNSNGDHYHVGIVETVNKSTGYITTIEGNTNSNGSSEGYIVYRHTRHYQYQNICCYGIPKYTGSHQIDTSYVTDFTAYPKATITVENIFDENHSQVSSTAWIGISDECTIHEVYTDGCCLLSYPLDSGGTNTVYSKISLFNSSLNSPPVNLGTRFYANIINTKSGMYVTNDQNNITMRSENKNNNQKWCFEKQSDGSYSIISTLDSLCMDVDSSGQVNGTNVKPYEYNGNDAQLWYVIGSPSKYMLKPKCNNLVLDVSNNDSFEGTNVQMWAPNGTVAQYFSINISDPPSITVTLNTNGGNCSDVSISVTIGNQYGKLPVPSKRANAFLGWSLSTSVNDIITSETIVSTISNHTLYAIWGDITCIRKIEYNGHEYCLYSGNVSWWDAKEFCEAKGGYLATVADANEQNIINSLNEEGVYLWLGASDIDLDENWEWVTGESFNYTFWMDGEPNYSGDIEMFLGTFPYVWNDFAEVGDQIGGFVLETPIEYTITFKDWDGTTLKTQTVNYGGTATAPTSPTRTGYTFAGWDKALNNIAANTTVTAQYSINSYTVTFKDWDGTTLKTQTVNHGSAASAPANPTRTGYTFTGWDKSFSNVTANTTVTAQYSINSYTVTFKDWDGTIFSTQNVNYGSAATAPANPVRTGYTFTGWDKTFSNITANTTVTAKYSINAYTVTFKDWDGSILKTQTVSYGSAATAPSNPSRTGYTFTGWDVAYNNVIFNLTVTAMYIKNNESHPNYTPGDVNNDKCVDNLDAAIILKYDAGIIGTINESTTDVNNDGVADNLDAAMILKYDAGIIDSF